MKAVLVKTIKWKWNRNKDWCFGLSISKDTTQSGYSIAIIILFLQIQLNFKEK